jgi:AcrR family transcriptional regulator
MPVGPLPAKRSRLLQTAGTPGIVGPAVPGSRSPQSSAQGLVERGLSRSPVASGSVDDVTAANDKPADEVTPAGDAAKERSVKGEQTKALILETAMRLFQERGYEKTTMRAIATEAGVSVGNAYYYYEGKEFLIQGFYDRMTHEHAADARTRMAGSTDFAERLQVALDSWVDCAADYHEFAAQFFRTAADPNSALSPFSNESHPARATAVQIFREVLDGSDLGLKLDPELKELLPDLLWLHLMVVVLYWVFDRTEALQGPYPVRALCLRRRLGVRIRPGTRGGSPSGAARPGGRFRRGGLR